MYLRALEIQGFKSFPDKTVLNFGEDITAIVGPNGSGKSNISDAICWVMGEQSARSLRGNKMEDVIFGGTEKRSAMGFAQVTLVLDNSEGIFPSVESSEVMVTRRYYRSGESEYYINKQSARLRDINELFMDTGLGREGYSIIGQGRIDEILSVRSADRREIFEEAAGISKFRHRKEESERRLQRTEENLVRIGDKISELELQVEPLRDQAEKAQRYLILRDELRLLEISVWMEKLEEVRASTIKLQAECAAAKARQEEAAAQLETLYAENETFSQKMQQNDLEQEQVRQEATGLDAQAGDQESTVAVLRASAKHNQESIALLRRELEDQSDRSQAIRGQMDEQRHRIEDIETRSGELGRELETLLEEARTVAEGAGSAAQEAQALQARETLALSAAADGRERVSALNAGLVQLEERRAAIEQELSTAAARLEGVKRDAAQAEQALEDARDEVDAAANVIQGYSLRMEGREKRAEGAEALCRKLEMERSNLASRTKMLSEMEKEYEGFNKAVRVVMQAAGRNALQGVHGPAANLMRVEKKYAVALEVAMGAGMQNIVVDREEDAKDAIQFLKQRDGGRATFLPLTAIRGDELREKGVEGEHGFVGIASHLAAYAPEYGDVFRSILGRTVVVEDLDRGIAMARKYGHRFRVVTLDGQVINRGGAMTGGSVSKSAGIFSRANELETLRKRRVSLEEELAGARKDLEAAQRDRNAARYELQVAQDQRRCAEDAVLRFQGQVDHFRSLEENLTASVENLAGEKVALDGREADSRAQIEQVREKIAGFETEAARLRRAAEEKLAGQSDLQLLSGKLGEDIAVKKAELAALAAERETTIRALGDMERVRADMEGDRTARLRRIGEYEQEIQRIEGEIGERTEAAASLRLRSQACHTRLTALRDDKLRLEGERGTMNQRIKTCNDQVLDAEREAGRLEQKLSAGNMEEKQLLDRLWETYELSHSAAAEQRIELESVPKANRRIGELKREIGSLGNVNVGAIEEFERVNTRYTYLTSQRDDVEQAKGELVGIIEEITREMTAIFAQQFALINTSFHETFQELFGGGQADLELEDLEDILGCGIEIKVQPPGKTLKTLSLLSGGEKAFVAIALYFAILKVHPTPFCVMDEIEAALDEANVVRYARYMRTIADKTQFIVITHRRGTMEEADVLYGVTMQEKGVSKMLSINLNEVAEELKIE